jgi:hypothetical protein
MIMYGRVEVYLQAFLNSALHGVVSFMPPREKAPGTHWIGSWVGPRQIFDAVAKRKDPFIAPTGNWTPVVQPVA